MNANMYLYYELINFFVFSLSKTLLRIRKKIFKIFSIIKKREYFFIISFLTKNMC